MNNSKNTVIVFRFFSFLYNNEAEGLIMKALLLFCLLLLFCTGVDTEWIQFADLSNQMIQVEIKGHVMYPGVYEFKRGATIQELLNLAECYDDSDLGTINQTQILHHQDVLTIQQKTFDFIHLNSSSLEELCSLPGIGESTAQKIIEYRNQHLFQTLEDLMNVKGIGAKKFEALKGKIAL